MLDKRPKPPTLKTIAELTGLSLSTVSLSLRGGSQLKRETREKVEKVAAEIGYVPNRAGVRLRTGQTNVLTLVLSPERYSVDFTRKLLQGIGSRIEDSKYHLNVIPELSEDDPLSAVRYILQNKTSDGVIVTHTSARDPRVQMLADAGLAFVCHGRTEFFTPHAYHDFDAEGFAKMAVDRLLARGRKRFQLIVENKGTTYYSLLVNGFRRELMDKGLVADIGNAARVLASPQATREYGRSLATRADPFDAIVCDNELTAAAILGGLADEGKVLGHEFDLICKQTTEILPTLYGNLDTIAEDLFATGATLADLLIKRLEGMPETSLQTLHAPMPMWRNNS